MSILDKNVSFYKSKEETNNGTTRNLLGLLKSGDWHYYIDIIRAQEDEVLQDQMKLKLPCFTVPGVFGQRNNGGLIEPSGLAAVDLDCAEEYDSILLLKELSKIKYIAYAGLSCRGKRLFAIVPFRYPELYHRHYERLIQSFEDIGLPMGDTCHKAISQPRFVSYNTTDTCFFNHEAIPYYLLGPEKVIQSPRPQTTIISPPEYAPADPFGWCLEQISKSHSFERGNRHNFIVYLSRYCNMKGIIEADTLNGCLAYIEEDFSEEEITKIVEHVYATQSDSFNTYPFKPMEGE